MRSMVIVATREKPMERVGKGSLARQATLSSFEKEIEDAYQDFQRSAKTEPPTSWAREDIVDWLKHQTSDLVLKRDCELDPGDDLFRAGFDRYYYDCHDILILTLPIVSALSLYSLESQALFPVASLIFSAQHSSTSTRTSVLWRTLC